MRKLKFILFSIIISFGHFSHAQTGIGTTTPNASAKLDVFSTNKGFLPPRVTLTSATDVTTIASPAEGLMVYNVGSVGLQAGYYFWNGVNWATIATATSAGNGVTATNMVNLYAKAYSTASGDIANATSGYSFTVPVSGRYLFDFSCTGYSNATITYKVRQGTTDIGTDAQTSYNNTVHVEYNGKIEVNLQTGVTYNVYVNSTGSRDVGDYDRVYYKMVAGNLPVTGQSVDYGIARYTGADGSAIADNALVPFDATASGNIPWSGNKFTLKANKTYELESSLAIFISGSAVAGRFQIYDYTNSVTLANGLFMSQNGAGSNGQNANSPMKGIITPSSDIQVGIRLLDHYGPNGPSIVGNTAIVGVQSAPNASYFLVKQIGSSAMVNPWVLSGNDVYNTTGEVGIGTTTPAASALLDLTSTAKGMLIPRMTTTQKTAIATPSTGLLVFQTDAPAGFYYYNGTGWLNLSNLGTNNRYIPYSTNANFYMAGQSLAGAASGTYIDISNSDLVIDVPSGFSSNRVIIKWDTWGDVASTNTAHGSFRYRIAQTGTSANTFNSAAMNSWSTSSATTGSFTVRFATPVTYIINDLAPGTYTFKLQISREGEVGTVGGLNNYQVGGTVQVLVK